MKPSMFTSPCFHLPKTPAECSDLTQNNAPGFIHIYKAGEGTAIDSCLWFCSMWTESGIWEKSGLIYRCVIICVKVGHEKRPTSMKVVLKDQGVLICRKKQPLKGGTSLAWKERSSKRTQRIRQLSCTILHKLRIWSFSPLGKFK